MKTMLTALALLFLTTLHGEHLLFERTFRSAEDLRGIRKDPSVTLVREADGPSLRFSVSPDAADPRCTAKIPLRGEDLRGRRITCSAEVKMELGVPRKRWEGGWFAFWAAGKKGTKSAWERKVLGSGKSAWKSVSFSCDVPDTVTRGTLEIGIVGSSGTIHFRNLKIVAGPVLLPLEACANWGFSDSVAGDRKGGWHDQGSSQDGSSFPIRRKSFANVPFRVIDPKKNNGRAIVALRCPRLPDAPERVAVKLAHPVRGKYLYLLHTSAWADPKGTVSGFVELKGENGKKEIPVRYGKDLTDWWKGNPVENAAVGAVIVPKDGFGGAYVSRFAIPEEIGGVSEIVFRKNPESKTLWLLIAATISDERYSLPKPERQKVTENDVWKALPQTVKPAAEAGSALDFAGLFPKHEIGEFGRVVAGKSGHFEFEKRPGIPIRFLAFNQNREFGKYFTGVTEIASRQDAEEYADQVVRGGYNLVRIWARHMRDLEWKKLNAFEYSPRVRDQFDYFLYCLRKRGVYVYLSLPVPHIGFDRCYPWGGAEKQDWDLYRHKRDYDAWCRNAELVLNHVNPYTKMRWIDDPQIAFIDCNNEQEFAFLRADNRYAALFRTFLKQKYGTPERLKQAWGKEAETISSFDDIRTFQPLAKDSPGQLGRDRAEFITQQERGLYERERAFLRKLGYAGPVTTFAMGKSMRHAEVRRDFDFVTMNGYHDHPSAGPLKRGSRIHQTSSIGSAANTVCGYLATRLSGKPFLVSEHGHCFWNKYRYEHGFVLGGYAALNGFDALTAFAMAPTRNFNRKIVDFEIRFDPIRRATERIIALLYRRGDVRTAPFGARITLDPKEVIRSNQLTESVSSAQLRLGLVGRCSVDLTGKPEQKDEILLSRLGASGMAVRRADASIQDSRNTQFDMDRTLNSLKKRGLLPAENRTDAARDFFVSTTGELVLDAGKKRMTIDTDRFQGLCAEAGSQATFRNFQVRSMNRRGCLALASIDGVKSIRDAKRLLLFVVTNALNSGMEFEDGEQRNCLNHGSTPILLETGTFSLAVRTEKAGKMTLYALGLDGRRLERIPVRKTADGIEFTLRTAEIRNGPSLYFELIEE